MMLPRRSTILGGAALAAGAAAFGRARPAHDRHDQAELRAGADRDRRLPGRSRRRARSPASSATTCRTPACSARSRPAPSSSRTSMPTRRRAFPTGAASARPASSSARSRRPAATSRSTSGCGTSSVGQQATGLSFTSQPANWRRLAHIIADAIYKRVTGEEGYFDTRIAYVSESGPLNARVKRIAIMDQDGANNRYITDGRTIAHHAALLADAAGDRLHGLRRGSQPAARLSAERRQRPARAAGQLPRHELRAALLARRHQGGDEHLGQDGQSDIYEMDVRGRALRRLTNSPAIDTSPCYSNDGTQIVFNSDRGGTQQLYVMTRGRRRRAAHQLRRGPLRHAGVVAARRLHRLHQDHRRRLRHRRHADRRQRRAHAGQRLPRRGPDLGAQRPRAGLLPPATQFGRPRRVGHFAPDRHHGTIRAPDADAGDASDPAWSPLIPQ